MGFEELLGVNPWTALFTLANTIALFLVLKKFLFQPVLKMIQDRQKEIDDMYTQADSAKASALEMEKEYTLKLEQAAATGEQIVKDAVARGNQRQEEIVNQANLEAAALRKKASNEIAMEKKKAMNEAKDEIAELAMDIAGKVVGKSLEISAQRELVNDFIDRLGDDL